MSPNEDRARKILAMVAYMAADPRESDVAMLTAQFDAVEAAAKLQTVDKVSEILGRCVQSVIVGVLGNG
jgi:hypothetical protein